MKSKFQSSLNLICVGAWGALAACGGGGGGSASKATTIGAMFDVADGALSSISDAGGFQASFVGLKNAVPLAGLFTETQSTVDPRCSTKGTAWGTSGTLGPSDAEYAMGTFHCLSTFDAGSPETVRGSFAAPKAVTCALEKAMGTISYSTAGTNVGPVDITVTTECFAQSMVDEMGNGTVITVDTVRPYTLDASTGWNKKISIASTEANLDFSVSFFNKGSKIGFKTGEPGNGSGGGSSVAVTVDTDTGLLLWNGIDDREGAGGADSAYRRVGRLRIQGEMNSDGEFTSITSGQGLFAQSADYANHPTDMAAATIIGTSSSGFRTWSNTYSSSTWASAQTQCYDGSCSGVSALDLSASTNANFYQNSTNRADWKTYRESGKPICDDGDITYAKTPASGAFGVCN